MNSLIHPRTNFKSSLTKLTLEKFNYKKDETHGKLNKYLIKTARGRHETKFFFFGKDFLRQPIEK
jgi:hypothetical protein